MAREPGDFMLLICHDDDNNKNSGIGIFCTNQLELMLSMASLGLEKSIYLPSHKLKYIMIYKCINTLIIVTIKMKTYLLKVYLW